VRLAARTDVRGTHRNTRSNPWKSAGEPRMGSRQPALTELSSGRQETSKGNKAQGRIGRRFIGNDDSTLRTRQRSKASKPTPRRILSRTINLETGRSTSDGECAAQTLRQWTDQVAMRIATILMTLGRGARQKVRTTARRQRLRKRRTAAGEGNSSKGVIRVAGNGPRHPGGNVGKQGQETRRTPGSVAGCNKPASSVRSKPSKW